MALKSSSVSQRCRAQGRGSSLCRDLLWRVGGGTSEEPLSREWAWMIRDPKSRKGVCQEVGTGLRLGAFLGLSPLPPWVPLAPTCLVSGDS